jgi:hypothetical protein
VLHLAAGELAIAVGSKGGEGKGMVVKDLKPLGGPSVKRFYTLFMYWVNLVKSIKSCKKSKNSKLSFVVLSITRTTTFSKYVYTFELQVFLEK